MQRGLPDTACPVRPCCLRSVPPHQHPSRSALPSTSSSLCTRAPSSTSQSACSRSSHSQSSLTRWASRLRCTPHPQDSRLVCMLGKPHMVLFMGCDWNSTLPLNTVHRNLLKCYLDLKTSHKGQFF